MISVRLTGTILAPNKTFNEKTQDAIIKIKNVVDKHAPTKHASRSKQKQMKKPWITTGILKSIKKKQKLYRTHFLSNDPVKKNEYKKYANILSHLKNNNKANYFSLQFSKTKDNLKSTWKLIAQLIKRKTKGQSFPTRLISNDQTFTKESDIADELNTFFTNVGPNLADKI